jgi:hypothetical protein
MLWVRWFRFWWGALFLWAVVLGGATGAWKWVIWPYLVVVAFLVFANHLKTKEPELARRLKITVLLLTLAYNGVLSFPTVFQALARRQHATDIETAIWLEPCLTSIKESVRTYTLKKETVEAAALDRRLNALIEKAKAGFLTAADREEEKAIQQDIRQLGRDRNEWLGVLEACGEPRPGSPSPNEPGGGGAAQPNPGSPQASGEVAGRQGPSVKAAPPADDRHARGKRLLGTQAPTGTWLAVIKEGRSRSDLAEPLQRLFGSAAVFPDAFVDEGFASQLWSGESDPADFGLSATEKVVLVQVKENTVPNNDAAPGQGIVTSEVTLQVLIIDPKTHTRRQVRGQGTGVGFSVEAAEKLGVDRAVDQLRTKV